MGIDTIQPISLDQASHIASSFVDDFNKNVFAKEEKKNNYRSPRKQASISQNNSNDNNNNDNLDSGSYEFKLEIMRQKVSGLQREKNQIQHELETYKKYYFQERRDKLELEERLRIQGIPAKPISAKCNGTCQYAKKNQEFISRYLDQHNSFYNL